MVGLRGVLKGDLKGLDSASELSSRRRLRGGWGDIVFSAALVLVLCRVWSSAFAWEA